MFQQVTLVGRLGNDPELRQTPNGTPVTNFNLAVNKRWTNSDGQLQDKTNWFRITSWEKQAETCAQYLSKGSQVLVTGEIDEARPWTDKDGNARASVEITAQRVRFLTTNNSSEANTNGTQAAAAAADVTSADVPF